MKKLNSVLILILVGFGIIHNSVAILCYSCGDATDNEEEADCTYKIERMRKQRMDFEAVENNTLTANYSYLKNCSHYEWPNGTKRFEYCKIEEVQSYGTVNAYIRDCSNMSNFSPVNVTSLQFLKDDNQTICGYSHLQYATICVRVCKGDFCNGPSSGESLKASAFLTMTLSLIALALVVKTRFRG